MKCPKCQSENREEARFCLECGEKLERKCPQCGKPFPFSAKFCDECGQRLGEIAKAETVATEARGERKYVTILFSDLSGYTAMTEKLDPEEVKEIMGRVFGEIAQVVAKYEGFIEKFIGDAVVAIFGVPRAHEDDPIRAIRAAQEIHDLVTAISPKLHDRVGRSLAMHSGINTGLVVAGELDPNKGSHGLLGDAINVASRLSSLAQAGEILVGRETHRQAEGHFVFETLDPVAVKGKSEEIQRYRVLSPKERPVTVHRFSGLRSDLIGRKAEMSQLEEAVRRLGEGKGTIISICGDAGTGKSRLVEEFRATLDLEEILWLEGNAYAYAQNISYFPFIDMLNRVWAIEEGDPPERVKEKLESNLEPLIGMSKDFVPYIGGLYALKYPEAEGVSPEFWKSRLFEAVSGVLGSLAHRQPTAICLQDLHWADPSTLDLLRFVMLESRLPALIILVYRPPFNLFSSHQMDSLGGTYEEIRLQDLSPSDVQNMMESLLRTQDIPQGLQKYVHGKVEGNPFYVEEIINSLIESGTLTHRGGAWNLARPIDESEVPPTVQGVVSARLDRLEKEMKRILQEASVIGRTFLYEILKRITRLREQMDGCLLGLERLDFIRSRTIQPELEYIFKHALTQEVVYNGLLKKDRQTLHGQIGLVMEEIFKGRLPEFYETLAYHYRHAESLLKMVDYLVKSGEKSLKRYAVEESHRSFAEAYDALARKENKTAEEKRLLIDLLIRWAFVFYYRGDFRELFDLLTTHVEMADSLADKALQGMFYGWFGFAMECRGRVRDSYKYLRRALELGEETGNERTIGYACTWLTWTCGHMGLLQEAESYGRRAQDSAARIPSEPYLYFKSLGGLGTVYYHRGDRKRTLEAGQALLDYGQRHGNIRCQVMGHMTSGRAYMIDGDFAAAASHAEEGIRISADPFYTLFSRMLLGGACLLLGDLEKAEEALGECVAFTEKFGCEGAGGLSRLFLGPLKAQRGDMGHGLRMVEAAQVEYLENGNKMSYAFSEFMLGRIYLGMVTTTGSMRLSTLARNAGFLIRHVPFAAQKAEGHLNKSLEVAREVGTKGATGVALLSMAQLHSAKGRKDRARECVSEAIGLFRQCDARNYLKQAEEVLASL
jgi:class 3 adenylate cyclase/tetratricopeptide (TPR) repeat protein